MKQSLHAVIAVTFEELARLRPVAAVLEKTSTCLQMKCYYDFSNRDDREDA